MNLFTLLGSIAIDGSAASTTIGEITSQAASMAETIGDKFTSVGTTISNIGTTLLPISTAVSALGSLAGYMSLDFEDAMAKVSTIADTSQVSLEDLETAIIELSNSTGTSASDIADNVYNAISAGQETADAVSFVESATKLATAGFTDSASAVDILTTIMNAYKLEAEDVDRVSDVLIATQNAGKVTVDELASSMGKLIPTANANGVELEQVAAGYAILTSQGIDSAEATTYMNSLLNELGTSSSGVAEILKEETGQSFKELMESGMSLSEVMEIINDNATASDLSFSDMLSSSEGAKSGLALLGDSAGEFNEILSQMEDSSGGTDEAFEKMQTTSYDLQVIWTKVKNSAIELGDSIVTYLIPYAEKAGEKVQELSDWFSGLSDNQKENIVQIGLVVAALAPFLIIVGKVMVGIGSLISTGASLMTFFSGLSISTTTLGTAFTVLTGPVGVAIAIILALIAVIATLWNTNEEFRTNVIEIWNSITTSFQEFGDAIKERLDLIGFDFGTFTDTMKAVWFAFCDLLAPYIEGVLTFISIAIDTALGVILGIIDFWIAIFNDDTSAALEALKSIYTTVWSGIQAIISTAFSTIKSITDVFLSWFGTSWSEVWSSAKTLISTVLSNIYTTVNSTISSVKTSISTGLNSAKSTVSSVLSDINTSFTSKMNSAKTTVSEAIAKIKSYFNFSWSLPTLKMPHFSISGSFSIDPPSTPSFGVEWYKDGGIMTDPTVFGINPTTGNAMVGGEAGPEAIAPISDLMSYVSEAVRSESGATEEILRDILVVIKEILLFLQGNSSDVYLDSSILVGALISKIDAALGTSQVSKSRGM